MRTGDPRSAATARAAITALVAATYLIMVVVNYGADALPLNGIRAGQVADSNPKLFAPALFTFAIWAVIYLLLAGHVLSQFGLFHRPGEQANRPALLNKVGCTSRSRRWPTPDAQQVSTRAVKTSGFAAAVRLADVRVRWTSM